MALVVIDWEQVAPIRRMAVLEGAKGYTGQGNTAAPKGVMGGETGSVREGGQELEGEIASYLCHFSDS